MGTLIQREVTIKAVAQEHPSLFHRTCKSLKRHLIKWNGICWIVQRNRIMCHSACPDAKQIMREQGLMNLMTKGHRTYYIWPNMPCCMTTSRRNTGTWQTCCCWWQILLAVFWLTLQVHNKVYLDPNSLYYYSMIAEKKSFKQIEKYLVAKTSAENCHQASSIW